MVILQPIHQAAILLTAILQAATLLLILQVVISLPFLLLELCLTNLQQLLQQMTLQSHRHKIQLNLQQSPLHMTKPSPQLKIQLNFLQSPPLNLQILPHRSHLRTRNHPRSRQTRQHPLHRSQAGLTRSFQSGTKHLIISCRHRHNS